MTDVNGIIGVQQVNKVSAEECKDTHYKAFDKRPPDRPAQVWALPQKEQNDCPTDKT